MSTKYFGGQSGYLKWYGLAIVSCSISTKYVMKNRFTAKNASTIQSARRRRNGTGHRRSEPFPLSMK
jgi:hypothetical protein